MINLLDADLVAINPNAEKAGQPSEGAPGSGDGALFAEHFARAQAELSESTTDVPEVVAAPDATLVPIPSVLPLLEGGQAQADGAASGASLTSVPIARIQLVSAAPDGGAPQAKAPTIDTSDVENIARYLLREAALAQGDNAAFSGSSAVGEPGQSLGTGALSVTADLSESGLAPAQTNTAGLSASAPAAPQVHGSTLPTAKLAFETGTPAEKIAAPQVPATPTPSSAPNDANTVPGPSLVDAAAVVDTDRAQRGAAIAIEQNAGANGFAVESRPARRRTEAAIASATSVAEASSAAGASEAGADLASSRANTAPKTPNPTIPSNISPPPNGTSAAQAELAGRTVNETTGATGTITSTEVTSEAGSDEPEVDSVRSQRTEANARSRVNEPRIQPERSSAEATTADHGQGDPSPGLTNELATAPAASANLTEPADLVAAPFSPPTSAEQVAELSETTGPARSARAEAQRVLDLAAARFDSMQDERLWDRRFSIDLSDTDGPVRLTIQPDGEGQHRIAFLVAHGQLRDELRRSMPQIRDAVAHFPIDISDVSIESFSEADQDSEATD